jgi:serine O-acetyltransferase
MMFNVVNYYRVANWFSRHHVPFFPRMIDYFIRLIFSCWMPHTARVGRNLVLGYGGLAVVIHSDAEIGDGVHIDQGVTIGGSGTRVGAPKIESNVYIGAGAKILGPITIGCGSIIGANAVVTKDVPPRSLAAGVPARIVRMDIDIDTFLYHKRVVEE